MFTVAQITVYLGKRDFVDHVSEVDPIGEWREEGGGRKGVGKRDRKRERERDRKGEGKRDREGEREIERERGKERWGGGGYPRKIV